MSKTIIVSNRLPLQIKTDKKTIKVLPSVGGLATGMKSVHENSESYWVGWTGLTEQEITDPVKQQIEIAIKKEKCVQVSLTKEEVDLFYFGFCNRTIWPLFHYFTEFAKFESNFWEKYKEVNKKFAKVVSTSFSGDSY